LFIALVPALFIIIYHYYYIYKVLTAKCQFCGKKIEDQAKRKIVYIYTPWRKPKFACLDCQRKINKT